MERKDIPELSGKELDKFLMTNIIKAIRNKKEFQYLEAMCLVNEMPFDKYIQDYCLDLYLEEMEIHGEIFKSKYVAMWKTIDYFFFTINEKFK